MRFLVILVQTVASALAQIRAHRARSFLTALGLIIAVAATTTVIGSMRGLEHGVLSQFQALGAKKVWIFGHVPRELRGVIDWRDAMLTVEEVEALGRNCESLERITPVTGMTFSIASRDRMLDAVPITGITSVWHEIEGRSVVRGRELTSVDDEQRSLVCLVNDLAIEELRLPRDPVGETILVGDWRFLVVGVVETNEVTMFEGGEAATEIFIPFDTARKLNKWSWIYAMAQLADPEGADDARAEIRYVLRNMRDLPPEWADTFEIHVLQQVIDAFRAVAAGITMIAAGVVGISLIVGGVGIMNIMLVSVSERTREIGLRKAVGARPAVVLSQFLVEAVTLCFVGGAIGATLGQALVLMVSKIPDSGLEEASVPPWALVLAFGFSALVGVVFGMFPAIKAAGLDPIAALRKD